MSSPQHTMKTSQLLRRFLPYFRKYLPMLLLDLFCASLTTVCELVLPLIVRNITTLATGNAAALTAAYVLRVGAMYVALRIVDSAASFYMSSRGHIMGTYIERDMRNKLFEHLQTLGFAYYSNAKVGQIMARITSDLFDVTEFAHHCPEEFFIAAIKIVVPFIILMGTSPLLTLIIFAMLPLMLVCTRFFNKRMRSVYKDSRRRGICAGQDRQRRRGCAAHGNGHGQDAHHHRHCGPSLVKWPHPPPAGCCAAVHSWRVGG